MKKQNGITLIALVISIIVMLILAGVSINAIVGENGILTKTQYATFLNEMAAVEEAVQLWKAGEVIGQNGEDNRVIPTNGLCNANDLNSADRLKGEVGYYRTWSMTTSKPALDILTPADTFNSEYSGELVIYPVGVQDLYYLNNEVIGIKGEKKYLIDATTGMIYSMTGIGLKGVSCYSKNMATAVMTGNMTEPVFVAATVSGSASGEKLAGNVTSEYLKNENGTYKLDESGNKIKNPNYNPNGFQIIADANSSNIFKLYNNGDLYGKGVKGIQLNTPVSEMEKINSNIWNEFTVPNVIPGATTNNVTIYPGYYNIYVKDSEGYLWGWGRNSNNKLGLTQEQQKEYTERNPVKLNVDGKKIKEVYPGEADNTFVITETNEVYACGYNEWGNLGLGYKSREVNEFTKINLSNVENIKKIIPISNGTFCWYKDNTFYFTGRNWYGYLSTGKYTEEYTNFTQIYNGVIGPDIDQDIEDMIVIGQGAMILKKDKTIWQVGSRENTASGGGGDLTGNNWSYQKFPDAFGTNVTGIYQAWNARLITRINDSGELEVWGTPGIQNNLGLPEEATNSNKYWKIELPEELKKDGVKEIFGGWYNIYYLSNSGKVYVSGNAETSGLDLKSGKVDGIVYANLDNIKTLYSTDIVKYNNFSYVCASPVCFSGNDGKIYAIGEASMVYRNNILQGDWTKIASNVLYFDGRGSAYIDRDNNLWVAGSDSKTLGLGEKSEKSQPIYNYILHTDSNIQGRVKEVITNSYGTYVLTINNELWVTGYHTRNGTRTYLGWSEVEDKSTFIKLLDDVKFFTSANNEYTKVAIKTNGDIYGWGYSHMGSIGISGTTNYEIPTKFTLPTEIGGIENIIKLKVGTLSRTHIITKTGEWFLTGTNGSTTVDGGHEATQIFSKYTYNLTLSKDEIIKDVVAMSDAIKLVLTSKGRIFGYGDAKRLGINNTSNERKEMQELTTITDVEQIVAGKEVFIAIKKDGSVWGTGSNIYGILGRWSGAPLSSGRYRTAFEWVECPELEI